jgi:protocatechuate 3,4-dioxygenase beta subunit
MKTRLTAIALLAAAPLLVLAHGSRNPEPRHVVLVSEDEPGQTLIVRGTVYAPDGATPVAGVRLDIHQTDATGYYCMAPSAERDRTLPRDNCPDSPPSAARLRGSLETNAAGRFEFHTIKPGSYPRSRNPAHIHFQASGAGYPAQWPPSLWFAGDPFIPADEAAKAKAAGKFNYICESQRAGNALVCEYNIRLKNR